MSLTLAISHKKAAMVFLAASSLIWAAPASAQKHAIDTGKSVMTVRLKTSGIFSAFGHDHEIAAPIAGGSADVSSHPSVELRADARSLRVRDPKASEKDRSKIQETMLGPEVLDSQRYPQILFRSTAVESMGSGQWRVRGNLSLHGQTRPVTVQVTEKAGHYVGQASFKQSGFGIKPVRVAGGTVRVKDEVRIEFDIQLARGEVKKTTDGPR